MVCTLVKDQNCLDSIGYKQLANGIMYFLTLMCLKLDLVMLGFFDSIYVRFLNTWWLTVYMYMYHDVHLNAQSHFCKASFKMGWPVHAICSYFLICLIFSFIYFHFFNVAKCNLGKVKLEQVGPWSSPIVVRDMRGSPLGSCRATLGGCS